MSSAGTDAKRKPGRPKGSVRKIDVRLNDAALMELDAWIAAQSEPRLSRPEAIRRILSKAIGKSVNAGSIDAEDLNASNNE